jgi:hypothetical protein
MSVSDITLDRLTPGDVYRNAHPETDVLVLSGTRPTTDRLDRPMLTFWARRTDTGAEGWITFGVGGLTRDVRPGELVRPQWGRPYVDDVAYLIPDDDHPGHHRAVWMRRGKHNRVRFYDFDGHQVGPEQSNVAPAVAYAHSQHWIVV